MVRIEDKRAKMESTKRYTVAFTEAYRNWIISKIIQSDKKDITKCNISPPNDLNDTKEQNCQEICNEINITLEAKDKKVHKDDPTEIYEERNQVPC